MLWCIMPELSLCIGLILIILYGLFSLSMSSPSGVNNSAVANSKGVNVGSAGSSAMMALDNITGPSLDRSASLNMVNLFLSDVYFFSRMWPVMLLLGYAIDFPLFAETSVVFNGAGPELNSSTGIGLSNGFSFEASATSLSYPGNNGIDVLLIFLTVVIMQSFKSFESVLLLLLAFVGQLFMLHSCDLVSFYICLEAQNFCFLVLCGLQPRVLKYSAVKKSVQPKEPPGCPL